MTAADMIGGNRFSLASDREDMRKGTKSSQRKGQKYYAL